MARDDVFYIGTPKRNIPAELTKTRDMADFFQSLLGWRSHLVRTGALLRWPTGVPIPDDTLIADGSAVSRTKYAALFQVYGETIGAGDGSTTFNIPNEVGFVVQT